MQEKLLVKLYSAAQSELQRLQSCVGQSGLWVGRCLSLLAPQVCPSGSLLGQQAAGELKGVLAAEGLSPCCHHRLQAVSRVYNGKIGRYGTMTAS